MSKSFLNALADAVLMVHALFIVFVVCGFVAIYLGWLLKWRWVRNRRFRVFHLVAISIVVAQSWVGAVCPLTIWEMALRDAAGAPVYTGSFIQHWLHRLIYFDLPAWLFLLIYTVFGGLVAASWFIVRPYPPK